MKRALITITTIGIFLLSCSVVFAGRPVPHQDRAKWVKEVLHGVELTPDELVLTVVSKGCSKKEHFYIDVNIGIASVPAYLLTVYRIVPDDCKKVPELVKLSYPIKDLGLEDPVELILVNTIGSSLHHPPKP